MSIGNYSLDRRSIYLLIQVSSEQDLTEIGREYFEEDVIDDVLDGTLYRFNPSEQWKRYGDIDAEFNVLDSKSNFSPTFYVPEHNICGLTITGSYYILRQASINYKFRSSIY